MYFIFGAFYLGFVWSTPYSFFVPFQVLIIKNLKELGPGTARTILFHMAVIPKLLQCFFVGRDKDGKGALIVLQML